MTLHNALGDLALDATAKEIRDGVLPPARVVTISGAIPAAGNALTLPCAGFSSFTVQRTAGAGSVSVLASLDDGANWLWLQLQVTNDQNVPGISQTISGNSGVDAVQGSLPPGTTHVRAQANNAGGLTVNLAASTAPYAPFFQQIGPSANAVQGVTIKPGTALIGFVGPNGKWTDETSAPLAAGATWTAATALSARDLAGVTSGNSFNQVATPKELRLAAMADVAGTLYLEVSHDGATYHRVKAAALAQPDPTCRFYGEIVHRPSTRYWRAVFVNGPAAQTVFRVASTVVSV